MDELKITEIVLPAVKANFEDIKAELEIRAKRYQGVVVDRDNLPLCKDIQKELSSLSRNIDRFRIDTKKELAAPIDEFDSMCKELQQIVQEVLIPLKEDIKVYEDEAKEAKFSMAKNIIHEVCGEMGYPSYEDLIEIKPFYGNVSTSKKKIREDVVEQITSLNHEELLRQSRLHMFEQIIDIENETLPTKMTVDDFGVIIDGGADDDTVIGEIRATANMMRRIVPPEEEEPKKEAEGYLIRILEDKNTKDKVLGILRDNGIMALEEK